MPEPKKKIPDIPDAKPVKASGPGNLSIKSDPPELTITGPAGIYRDGMRGDMLVIGVFGVTLDATAKIVQADGSVKTRTFFSDGKLHVILEKGQWDKTPVEIHFNLSY